MNFPKRSEIKVGTVAWVTTDSTKAVVTSVFAVDGLVWGFTVRVLEPKARKLSPTMQKVLDAAAKGTVPSDRCVIGRSTTIGALFGAGATEIGFAYTTRDCLQPSRDGGTHRLPVAANAA